MGFISTLSYFWGPWWWHLCRMLSLVPFPLGDGDVDDDVAAVGRCRYDDPSSPVAVCSCWLAFWRRRRSCRLSCNNVVVSLMGRSSGVMRVIIKQFTKLSFSKDRFAIEPNADLLSQFLLVIFSENLNTTELQVDTNANKIPRGPHIAAYEKIMFKKPQIDCCYDYAWEAIAKIRISVS